jgi:hypothetical protein
MMKPLHDLSYSRRNLVVDGLHLLRISSIVLNHAWGYPFWFGVAGVGILPLTGLHETASLKWSVK